MWLLLVPYSLGLTSTFISISSFIKSVFFQDEELRTYFAIVAISTGLIFLNIFGIHHNLADSFQIPFFQCQPSSQQPVLV